MSIARTAELAGCSIAQVKRVTALYRARHPGSELVTAPHTASEP
jgi:hypothetical protein